MGDLLGHSKPQCFAKQPSVPSMPAQNTDPCSAASVPNHLSRVSIAPRKDRCGRLHATCFLSMSWPLCAPCYALLSTRNCLIEAHFKEMF